jgi:hypothetical protein
VVSGDKPKISQKYKAANSWSRLQMANFSLTDIKKKWLDCRKLKKGSKKLELVSYIIMIGYDLYDRFTMEHFPLRQNMILTSSFFARDSTCQKLNCRIEFKKIPRINAIVKCLVNIARAEEGMSIRFVAQRYNINKKTELM